MSDGLVSRVRKCALLRSPDLAYGPAFPDVIKATESQLGFSLPPLLHACYEHVANGGFGPGYGIIGLEDGAESDFGTLVETYYQLKSDQESEGNEWKAGMLPFCAWGCNIFSCVDCSENDYDMYLFEDFDVWPQAYSLEEFFSMYVSGIDILSYENGDQIETEIINPFTGERSKVTKREQT